MHKKIIKNSNVIYLRKEDSEDFKIKRIVSTLFNKLYIVNTKQAFLNKFQIEEINIILIDIDVFDIKKWDFIKIIRKTNNTIPIIVITKNKELNTILESVKFNLTAYLLKPLDISKFIESLNDAKKIIFESSNIITIVEDKLKYNFTQRVLYKRNSIEKLTKNETKLLELFLQNQNKIIQKEEIKNYIWRDKEISESGFKSLIKRLSDKLEEDIIVNNFGVGYIFKTK